MKKFTFLTMMLICIASIAKAQITKGTVLLGGGVSVNTYKSESGTDENRQNGFTITPAIGLTIKDNIVAGFKGGYGHSENKNVNGPLEQKAQTNSFTFGLFLRRYLSLGKNFYLFGESGVDVGFSKNTQPSSDFKYTTKQKSISINLYPGIAYAVNKRIHLEASINNLIYLNYSTAKTENNIPGAQTSSSKGFAFGSNVSSSIPLSVGFRFVLGK